MPSIIAQELADAMDEKFPNRDLKIFQTIAKGLNIIPDKQIEEWLGDLI